MPKFKTRQRPAKSTKRMMNLLFELDSKEEIIKKLNRFCEHRTFYFIACDRKKKDPAQMDLFNSGGDEDHLDHVDIAHDGNGY
jgi:hypothetical protein